MSKIAEQIQKLKEQEKRLERETRKVELLTHVLDSTKAYEHGSFIDVKGDVVSLLENFVKKTIEAIEAGTEVTITVGPAAPAQTPVTPVQTQVQPTPPAQTQKKPEDLVSPNEKLNFAMENRHLAGKKVSVMNDKNVNISGKVVGLDAPFVLVQTEAGPVIKVPLPNVSVG